MVAAGTCGDVVFKLDRTTSYLVWWTGDDPGYIGCQYEFEVEEDFKTIPHSICADVNDFTLKNPEIYLKFYEMPNKKASKVKY